MTRNRWILIGVVLVAAAAFLGWKWLNPPPVVDPWKIVAARRGNLTETITANGVINPVRVVSVGTQVSGTVQSLYADFNDRVAAGQVLLRLDPALFTSRLAASEASLANARATAALQAANAARAQQLVKQDFISRQDYETSVATAKSAGAAVQQAEAQIRQDRANLDFSVIRSPVSGVVISRQIDIGQTVAASFSTPTLFQIARDLTQMQIEAAVAEADVARVKKGQQVDFTVDAYGTRQFHGTVDQVRLNPTTQQNVVNYTVIVKAPNPDGALLPGMTANASFIVSERDNVLLVPNAALSFKPEGFQPQRGTGRATDEVTIFVEVAGKPEPRRVLLGASDAEMTEVTGGALKTGEAVITGTAVAAKKAGGLFSGPPGGRRESPNSGKGEGDAPAKPAPEPAPEPVK